MRDTALSVDIQKNLGKFRLQVQFEAGDERLALLGASGCGKSVTLRCVAGILRPDEGKIVLDGVTLFDSAAKIDLPPQRRHVGYLFQQYALFPNMTVRQNISAAVRDRSAREETTNRLIRQFQLEQSAGRRPGQLSGGQQQRTALARILASEPKALLLDEPFSALDFLTRVSMQEWLLEQWEKHRMTILFITHDVEEAVFLSGSVLAVDQTPIRRLSEIPVPAPYPRTRACLARPEMAELREELIEMLRRRVEV